MLMAAMVGLSDFISDVGSVITALVGYFSDILGLFTTEPVLAVIFGVFLTGAVIGLVTRLYRHA